MLTLALTTTAFAASASQTISVNFSYVSFSSILGGQISGNASVSGNISDAGLSGLRGTANLPLRDAKLSVDPTGTFLLQNEQLNIQWSRVTCNQFGCVYEYGFSQFERRFGTGPVDIRLGQLRGTGTLSLATNAVCVASCAPPGAYYYYTPTGFANLNGAVIGNDDAGTLNMSGPAPTIN
jgi:hypothetical protein